MTEDQSSRSPNRRAPAKRAMMGATNPRTAAPGTIRGDLGILFTGGHAPPTPLDKLIPKPSVVQAIDCLMGLTWEDYQGQVVEFLDSEHRTEYGTHSAWTNIQELVLDKLSSYA